MEYEPVASSEILWDGPLFADEIGWDKGLTATLREQFKLQSRRVVPAKSAMTGVVTIYFRPEHREWALVRYAERYRWIFLTLLGQGMSGEQRLLENGFSPDDIGFLYDIVPLPDESVSPAVYDILWRAAPFPAHIDVIAAIDDQRSFTPRSIIDEADEVEPEDAFVFERLIRCHLIERQGAGAHPNAHANGPGNAISVDLDATYQLTPEGETAIPRILAEYDRIFVDEEFEQLYINPDRDPESHLPAQPAGTEPETGQDAGAETSGDTDTAGILGELEAEFATLAEDSEGGSAHSTATDSGSTPQTHIHDEEPADTSAENTLGGSSSDDNKESAIQTGINGSAAAKQLRHADLSTLEREIEYIYTTTVDKIKDLKTQTAEDSSQHRTDAEVVRNPIVSAIRQGTKQVNGILLISEKVPEDAVQMVTEANDNAIERFEQLYAVYEEGDLASESDQTPEETLFEKVFQLLERAESSTIDIVRAFIEEG